MEEALKVVYKIFSGGVYSQGSREVGVWLRHSRGVLTVIICADQEFAKNQKGRKTFQAKETTSGKVHANDLLGFQLRVPSEGLAGNKTPQIGG